MVQALQAPASSSAPLSRASRERSAVRCAATPPKVLPPLEDGYVYTPRGRKVPKPTNAFEQFQFDFFFVAPAVEPAPGSWAKALADFTNETYKGGLRDWAAIHTELKRRKLKTVTPEAAAAAVSTRVPSPLDALFAPPVLLDVREEDVSARSRPLGSFNVPLYNTLDAPANAFEWYRYISFAIGFAKKAPVRNTAFLEQVKAKLGGRRPSTIYVICAAGGTMETASERKKRSPRLPAPMNLEYGCCSRSLIACHELIVKGGYPNVVHVDGGFSRWANRQLPGEADV